MYMTTKLVAHFYMPSPNWQCYVELVTGNIEDCRLVGILIVCVHVMRVVFACVKSAFSQIPSNFLRTGLVGDIEEERLTGEYELFGCRRWSQIVEIAIVREQHVE